MHRLVVCITTALTGLAAQEPVPRPSRSIAAGLVRQQIEIEKLRPPTAQQGMEIGAGEGPLVLLVWRTGGALALSELQRGAGDGTPSPTPRKLDLKEEFKEVKPQPGGEVKEGTADEPATVRLALAGAEVVATASGAEMTATECSRGKQLDAATLKPRLQALLTAVKAKPHAGMLYVDAAPEVPMQQVLTLWETARGVGFTDIAFANGQSHRTLPAPGPEQIAGLAKQFEWPTKQVAGGAMTQCEGELLILLDGPATYDEMVPLLIHLSRAGIWRFGFVAKQDAKTYVKLPTNLPFDRGR